MTGVRLDLAYHGAGFSGWAAQPGKRTVQGELEGALERILGGSDAAHRRGQDRRRGPRLGSGGELRRGDRAARGARPGAQLAHRPRPGREGSRPGRGASTRAAMPSRARTATGCSPSEAPIPSRPGYRCSGRIGSTVTRSPAAPMRCGAPMTSRRSRPPRPSTFASSGTSCAPSGTQKPAVLGEGTVLELWIEADAFMRNMVRVLVGTMLEVAGGRRPLEDFARAARGRPAGAGGGHRPGPRPPPGVRPLLRSVPRMERGRPLLESN